MIFSEVYDLRKKWTFKVKKKRAISYFVNLENK